MMNTPTTVTCIDCGHEYDDHHETDWTFCPECGVRNESVLPDEDDAGPCCLGQAYGAPDHTPGCFAG